MEPLPQPHQGAIQIPTGRSPAGTHTSEGLWKCLLGVISVV